MKDNTIKLLGKIGIKSLGSRVRQSNLRFDAQSGIHKREI